MKNKLYILFLPAIIGSFSGRILNVFDGGLIPLSMFQLGLLLLFPLLLVSVLVYNTHYIKIPSISVEVVIFIAILCLSVFYSVNKEAGLFFFVRIITLFVFGYLLYNYLNTITSINFVVMVIVITSVPVALWGIYSIIQNPQALAMSATSTLGKIYERTTGPENDPNVFASYFIFPVTFLFVKGINEKKLSLKAIYFSSMLIILACVATTYSRSVWVSIFLASSFIIIYYKKFSIPVSIVLLVLLAAVYFEPVRLLITTVIGRVFSLLDGNLDDSNRVRLVLAIGAFDMFTSSFGLGVGLRGFPVHFKENFDIQKTVGIYEPHNLFYEIPAEQGFLGLLIFTLLYIRFFSMAKNNMKIYDYRLNHISVALFATFIGLSFFYLLYGGGLVDNRTYIYGAILLAINDKLLLQQNN